MTIEQTENMTMREFIIWFYSKQSKSWLVSEAVRDTLFGMENSSIYENEWLELAKTCGVNIQNV